MSGIPAGANRGYFHPAFAHLLQGSQVQLCADAVVLIVWPDCQQLDLAYFCVCVQVINDVSGHFLFDNGDEGMVFLLL